LAAAAADFQQLQKIWIENCEMLMNALVLELAAAAAAAAAAAYSGTLHLLAYAT
jgi:hypothetical protein